MIVLGSKLDKELISPNAPAELTRFAFLIGRWRFDTKFKAANEELQAFHGAWLGHYILDGYAIADEYRMIGSSGELICARQPKAHEDN
jgi:hypothetical protein